MNKYNITKEKLKEYLEDIKIKDTNSTFKVYVECTVDENGNYRSEFLEMFDKAMKDNLKKSNEI